MSLFYDVPGPARALEAERGLPSGRFLGGIDREAIASEGISVTAAGASPRSVHRRKPFGPKRVRNSRKCGPACHKSAGSSVLQVSGPCGPPSGLNIEGMS